MASSCDPNYFNRPMTYCGQCGRGCGCAPTYANQSFDFGTFVATFVTHAEIKPPKLPSKKYDGWAAFYRTLKTPTFARPGRGRRQSIPDRLVPK